METKSGVLGSKTLISVLVSSAGLAIFSTGFFFFFFMSKPHTNWKDEHILYRRNEEIAQITVFKATK